MAIENLNKVNYVDADFATASASVRNFLSTEYPDEFNDYIATNLGQGLIDIISYAEQNLMWYLNRRINDLYLPTAYTPKSVSKLARMLGYRASGAISSKTVINLSLPAGPYSFPVQIYRGFQFRDSNRNLWEYRGELPIVFAPGQVEVTGVEIAQGFTAINNFISTGETNQFFELLSAPLGTYVEDGQVVVRVDGEEWEEQNVIPFNNVNVYETNVLSSPPLLRFGDGVQGNVPAQGSGIEVTYFVTKGFQGRVTSGSIVEPAVPLVVNSQAISLQITQPNSSVGGQDPEDIRKVRVNAPLFQRVQDRAITKGDYDFLSNGFPGVVKADAQIVRGVSGDVVIQYLASNILTRVENAADGITDEAEVYVSGINYDAQELMSRTEELGDALKVALAPEVSAISGSASSIKSVTHQHIDQLYVDLGVSYDAAIEDLESIAVESEKLPNTISAKSDISINGINLILDAITSAVSGNAGIAANVNPLVLNIKTKLSEMKSSLVAAGGASYGAISTSATTLLSDMNTMMQNVRSLSGSLDTATEDDYGIIDSGLLTVNSVIDSEVDIYNFDTVATLASLQINVDGLNQVFIDGTSGLAGSVSGDIDHLLSHLNEHLTDSCNANLVQVKVLSVDAARRYVSPLQSTLDELKAYLDERKDAVHTVATVAGDVDIIDADVRVEIRVDENALEEDVLQRARDAITKSDAEPLGILVQRDFNKDLTVWEIHEAIRANLTDPQKEVVYLNIEIKGPAEYLDSKGNLRPGDNKVIQAGNIEVVAISRFS